MKTQECTATKQCNECGEVKPLSDFYTSRKTRKCKQCELIASHGRYMRRREAVLERCAEYRESNKDQIKEYLAGWYKRRKEHVLARCKEYNKLPEVKERESQRHKARWQAVRNELLARRKALRDGDPEIKKSVREYSKAHYRKNKPQYAARVGKRRAAKVTAIPKWADQKAIKRIYRLAADMSCATGVVHHVDHIVPLQGRNVCGLHVETNLQVIPGKDNLEKAFKFG